MNRMRLALITLATLLLFAPNAGAQQPNFVFVLTDDMSSDLVPYMRHVQAMQREGTSFDRYVVTDSLCCPSRASILTGRYPHSTGVRANVPPFGGFDVFHIVEEWSTFATSLQQVGYRTGLFGKYMNGYTPNGRVDDVRRFVPPGWSQWAGIGNGDRYFDYKLLVKPLNRPPQVVRYGNRRSDYATDVIARHGRRFITHAVRDRVPFMVELSVFAPHFPYTPAPRDADKFAGVQAPRGPTFNEEQLEGAPSWLAKRRLGDGMIADLDDTFRKRAQSMQAVDRMIGSIRAQLARLGAAHNTYIVFTSDNGFHTGQRRMRPGKQTFWDHDIRVPLVVVGPGVPAGATVNALAANVDLRPTFQELAGAPIGVRVEGRSLAPFLRGQAPASWRTMTSIEHLGPNWADGDPDRQRARQGNPPSYTALRFNDALYVEYLAGNPPEYYDLATDPHEQRNIYESLSPERKAELSARLARMLDCSGGPSCHAADAQ
jgi:arylsulfatase A-like enzyme